eukprot:m.108388 g.108388  ORF g.108388 m.108388 type:complete len:322 (+) comp37312_c0_seq1:93-1058(+)
MAACSTQETSWEKKLDTSLAYLSGNFNPNEKFLDALMAAQLPNGKCLLDYQERQKLDSCNLARSKLNELIAIVRFKHPREVAFELFCETLIATGNKAVVEEFNKPKNTGYEEPQLIPRSANSSAGLKKEDALASGMERLGLSSMSPDGLDNDSHNAAPRPAYSSTRLPSQGSGGPYSSGGHRKSLDSEGSVHKRTGASNSQSSRYGSTFLNKACDEVPQLPSGDLSKSDLRSHIASLTEEIFKFIGIIKIQTKKLKETQEKAKSTKRDLCQASMMLPLSLCGLPLRFYIELLTLRVLKCRERVRELTRVIPKDKRGGHLKG